MRTINILLIIIVLTLSQTYTLYSQDDLDMLDNKDIEIFFNKLGMKVFKFPINSKEPTYLKITNKCFKGNELVKTNQINENALEMFKGKFKVHDSTNILRIYCYNKEQPEKFEIQCVYKYITCGIETSIEIGDDEPEPGLSNWRKFDVDFDELQKGVQYPILMRYGVKEDEGLLNCPGGATLEQATEIFYFVEAIIIELI